LRDLADIEYYRGKIQHFACLPSLQLFLIGLTYCTSELDTPKHTKTENQYAYISTTA
jgi:hypothetical protein